ncbi:hypothetical protein HY498_03845 [Candidatus Woesearchaeota archaeon]|nr:hypothetical protein [Candidatus Woesearchaeota archaeon]
MNWNGFKLFLVLLVMVFSIQISEANNESSQLKSELINETLFITNIGDRDFNESISVNLGDYIITKKKILKEGDIIKINLKSEVKPGVYDIKVLPTGEVFNRVLISKSGVYYYISFWKEFLIFLVIIILIIFSYKKFEPYFKNKEEDYIEVKSDKRKFIIESRKKPKFKFGKKEKEEFIVMPKKPKPPENQEGGFMKMFD